MNIKPARTPPDEGHVLADKDRVPTTPGTPPAHHPEHGGDEADFRAVMARDEPGSDAAPKGVPGAAPPKRSASASRVDRQHVPGLPLYALVLTVESLPDFTDVAATLSGAASNAAAAAATPPPAPETGAEGSLAPADVVALPPSALPPEAAALAALAPPPQAVASTRAGDGPDHRSPVEVQPRRVSADGPPRDIAAGGPPATDVVAPARVAATEPLVPTSLATSGPQAAAGSPGPRPPEVSGPHVSEAGDAGTKKEAGGHGASNQQQPDPGHSGARSSQTTDTAQYAPVVATIGSDASGTDKNLTPVRRLPSAGDGTDSASGGSATTGAVHSAQNQLVIRGAASGEIDHPELGRVAVSAHLRDGAVEVRVSAQRLETAGFLTPRADALADAARSGNVPVARVDIEVGSGGARGQSPTGAGDGAGHPEHPSRHDDGDAPGTTALQPSRRRVRIVL